MNEPNADTITDEQIRGVMRLIAGRVFPASGNAHTGFSNLWHECQTALGEVGLRHSVDHHGDCPQWCTACRKGRIARARVAAYLGAGVLP